MTFEVTKFVRGEEDAIKAQAMSENLFSHGGDDAPEFILESLGVHPSQFCPSSCLLASKEEGLLHQ